MARGIDLMLAGIYVIGNVTNQLDNGSYTLKDPDRYNWDVKWEEQRLKLGGTEAVDTPIALPTSLRIGTLQTPPYSGIEVRNGKPVGVGHAFEIFNIVMSDLGLTYELITEGTSLGNATSGVLGLLREKKIDMIVAFLPFLYEFHEFAWFGPTLEETNIMVLMKRPSESALGSGLLAPFSTTVWICILVSLIIFGPVIYVFSNYRSSLLNNTKIDKFDFTSSVWFTYGAILKQGSSINPINNSTRIIFATWWIFITILTSFYTANLTAFLTLSQFTLPFKTIGEIVAYKIDWITGADRTISNMLETGEGYRVQELWNSYHAKTGHIRQFQHNNDVLPQLNERQLFIGEREILEKTIFDDYQRQTRLDILENKRCTYVIMPECLYKIPRGFIHHKDSLLREVIDKKVQTLIEVGIIKHLLKVSLPQVQYCPLNLKSTERTLRNSDLSLTYKIITGGFISAILTFIREIWRCKKHRLCLCCRWKCFCCRSRLQMKIATQQETPRSPKRNNYFGGRNNNADSNVKDQEFRNNFVNSNFYNGTIVDKETPIQEWINPGNAQKTYVNGRDYLLITAPRGDKRLIPIRTPSALLFQYRT